MDWTSHERMCEDAAFGQYLIETIAENIGVKPKPEMIDRAVRKSTSCGVWVEFDEKGIVVGATVEGTDAEFKERVALSDEPKELIDNFWSAVNRCEGLYRKHLSKEPKLNMGDQIEVHGWIMLSGLPAGKYRIRNRGVWKGTQFYDFTTPRGTKQIVRHACSSVDAWIRDAEDEDLNKIVVLKRAS